MTPALAAVLASTILVAFASDDEEIYRVARTARPAAELLQGDDAAWRGARRITWGPPAYPTSFEALWNDAGLFVRFRATDPDPWHTLEDRDDPLWDEEVVEIFLDLDGSGTHYAEIEVSPANVVCDVRMIAPFPDKQMDLAWNLDGLVSRASVDDAGWTVLAQLPWVGLRSLPSASSVSLPPEAGDRFRFNVFRIERPHGPDEPERDVVFAAWSPPSGASFHEPAVFRDLVFEAR